MIYLTYIISLNENMQDALNKAIVMVCCKDLCLLAILLAQYLQTKSYIFLLYFGIHKVLWPCKRLTVLIYGQWLMEKSRYTLFRALSETKMTNDNNNRLN